MYYICCKRRDQPSTLGIDTRRLGWVEGGGLGSDFRGGHGVSISNFACVMHDICNMVTTGRERQQ